MKIDVSETLESNGASLYHDNKLIILGKATPDMSKWARNEGYEHLKMPNKMLLNKRTWF